MKRRAFGIVTALLLALGVTSVPTIPASAAPAPTVTSVSPASGPLAGGTFVTITGTGFVDGTAPNIAGNTLSGVYWVNPTTLIGSTRPSTAGAKEVMVTNPDGQQGRLAGGFTYDPALTGPTVTTDAPSGVTTTGATFSGHVTVRGDSASVNVYFEYGPAEIYWTNRADATPSILTTPGVFTASVTGLKPYTAYHFRAWGVGDGNAARTSDRTFLTLAPFTPTVTGIAPDSGPVPGGTPVTITGTGFLEGATVTIGGVEATGATWSSATSITAITANTTARSAGASDVVVTNPDLQMGVLTGGFNYDPAPTVTSITPTSGPATGGTPVTITGRSFVRGARVNIGGAAATEVAWVGSTSIMATTAAGADGANDVVVTNPDAQSGALSGGFTHITALTVTGIVPASGPTGGGTSVNITGTGFAVGAKVTIGGTAAKDVTRVGSTLITATAPAAAVGARDVVVTNPNALTASLTGGFTALATTPAGDKPAQAPRALPVSWLVLAITATVLAGGVNIYLMVKRRIVPPEE